MDMQAASLHPHRLVSLPSIRHPQMRVKMRIVRHPRPLRKLPPPVRIGIRPNRPRIRVVEAGVPPVLIVFNIWRVPKLRGGGDRHFNNDTPSFAPLHRFLKLASSSEDRPSQSCRKMLLSLCVYV